MPSAGPSQLSIILGLARFALRATFRNRANLVFSLAFPLAFVFVFGLFGSGAAPVSIGLSSSLRGTVMGRALVGLAAQPNSPIELTVADDGALETKVAASKLAAAVEGDSAKPGGFTLVTSTANLIGAQTASGIVRSVADAVNLKAAVAAAGGGFTAPIAIGTRDIAGRESRYIDFVLPGMIGFSIISTATFGTAFPFLTLRRTLVLKRMLVTCARPLSFVVSQCLSRGVQATYQSAIILGFGVAVFHFGLPHGAATFVEAMFIAVLGILSFTGFGILLANLARDEQTAPLLLNLFNLPQFLLSGVFFPIDSMPKWVQLIGDNLPLSFMNAAMRKVTTDGQHLNACLPQIAGMLVWSVVAYGLAAKTFQVE